jgi:type II secretory ATPase GspE/PulE/Tfp pilus assembly ATPase PilB-like protein/CheY-like chemotaxis protein
MNQPQTPHWLTSVAAQAGLKLALSQPPDLATLRRAWSSTVQACQVTDERFTERAAAHFRMGVADLSTWDPQAVRLIPEAVARKYGIVAISFTDTTIVVATSDPANRFAVQEIVANAGRHPVFLLASPQNLARAMERAYAPTRAPRNALQTLVAQVASSDFQVVTSAGKGLFTSFELQDPAVVKLSDLILQQALRYRATEVHIEPGRQAGRIRFRIDGVLQHVVDLPAGAHGRLVARLKHVAFDQPGIDLSEGFPIGAGGDQARRGHLLTTPTPDGELVSIRLIAPNLVPTLESLHFDGPEGEKIRDVLRRRDGLVLVTGPARSGTTSFVYACLRALERLSVISLETRIELLVPGVTQIKYDASSGKSFAESLQQLLDRAPDVIHAGEIRDLATARIALRSAVTGRKVIATVHTSDAVSGVGRLTDMGLAGGRLAESFHAVISLRLVRRLCPDCKRAFNPADERPSRERKLAERMGIVPVSLAVGCKACAGTGYSGQLPLAEVLVFTPPLRSLLASDPTDEELLHAARKEGMRTFTEVALDRVAKGETTVEELERVLGVVPVHRESAEVIGPVLVVDDEPQDRLMIRTVLNQMGFRVVEADDGTTAKRILDSGEEDFSLVLLDLFMPQMSGIDLLREIRKSLATQSLPVIVLTSSPDPRDEIELLDAGADDYMLKPVVIDRVEARVRAVLRRSGVTLA